MTELERAYKQIDYLAKTLEITTKELDILRTALFNIIRHQKLIANSKILKTTAQRMAEDALKKL